MATDLEVYRVCSLANPFVYKRMRPTSHEFRTDIKSLKCFSTAMIDDFLRELPEYTALVMSTNFPEPNNYFEMMETCSQFWLNNRLRLPNLAVFVQYCYTITTSSAAAERAFSLLKCSFTEQQAVALEDFTATSIMMRYNQKSEATVV